MLESFLITSRETLEASLVVGITLAYLNRTNNKQYRKTVFIGIVAAILMSILTAVLFHQFAGGFEGRNEEIFEGITMIVGAALLTTMILWMMQQRQMAKEIEGKVARHLAHTSKLFTHTGIFLLIFVAILREGVETVIFLNAISYASGVNLLGGVLGILVAMVVGYLFFVSATKINLKKLFTFSSVLLILFAAGLVAHGVHEFEEAGVLNPIIYPVYNINHIVDDKGVFGSFLTGLFGYNGNPSLLEMIAYIVYLGAMSYVFVRFERQRSPRKLGSVAPAQRKAKGKR